MYRFQVNGFQKQKILCTERELKESFVENISLDRANNFITKLYFMFFPVSLATVSFLPPTLVAVFLLLLPSPIN